MKKYQLSDPKQADLFGLNFSKRKKTLANKPIVIPIGDNTYVAPTKKAAIAGATLPKKQLGGIPTNPNGLWEENGPVIIPGNRITMKDKKGMNTLPNRVMAFPNVGKPRMMNKGEEHYFPGATKVFEQPLYQLGGLWNTNKQGFVDSTLNANRNKKEFVKRLYEQNPKTLMIPGETDPSTHLMAYDPNTKRVYPEIVNRNGKLEHLTGDAAWDYADNTKEYIEFPTTEQAEWFANSKNKTSGYKMGVGVLGNTNVSKFGTKLKLQLGGSFYNSKEDREEYQQKLKNLYADGNIIGTSAIPYFRADRTKIKDNGVNLTNEENTCIDGVCGLMEKSGKKWNEGRYLSNTKLSDNIKGKDENEKKEDGYWVNDNFKIGDIVQATTDKGKAYDAKIIMNSYEKEGEKRYKIVGTSGKSTFEERDLSQNELKELIKNKERLVTRPGYSLDKEALEQERIFNPEAKEAIFRRNSINKFETENPNLWEYKIRDESKLAKNPPEGLKKYLEFANNTQTGNKLAKILNTSTAEVDDEMLNVAGELWQESKFNTSKSLESIFERIFKPKTKSIGPGQIRFSTLAPDLKNTFNINSPKDLYDYDKLLPLMVAMNIRNRKYLQNKGENLSKDLIGIPGVDAEHIRGGIGRWTPYMWNRGSIKDPKERLRKEAIKVLSQAPVDDALSPFQSKSEKPTEKDIEAYIKKNLVENQLYRAKGSYPRKVEDFIENNIERTSQFFDAIHPLPDVIVKPKKQLGGIIHAKELNGYFKRK